MDLILNMLLKMRGKNFIIALMSALSQYYEYHLFGFLASSIGRNFFPDSDPSVVLLKTYIIMLLGVSTKPFGAIVLGRIGDIYGRDRAITVSMLVTGLASLAICILPTYHSIGIVAAFILSLLRMLIASSTSSGSDGVRIYIYEKIDKKYKNLGSGLSTISTITGSFIASYSAWFFTQEAFPEHYWRFTFLIGSCASITICMIRKFLDKASSMQEEVNYGQYKNMSLFSIMKQNIRLVVLCAIVAGTIGASYGFQFTFFVNHNFAVLKNVSSSDMQFYRSSGIALYIIFAIFGGWIADLMSARVIASSALSGILLLNGINCYLIKQNTFYVSLYLAISALLPMATIPSLTLLNSAVPKVIRYRIFSMCHGLGAMIISGPSLIISTQLYQLSQISWLPIVYFSMVNALMLISMNLLFIAQKHNRYL